MYIAYYRTKKPQSVNFNLTAQKKAVREIGEPAEEFTEVEKPRVYVRPVLDTAIARARELQATLVIAKMDRLVRNPLVTKALMDSGIEFICCDQPTTNRNTIHILAAVADEEIHQRTIRMRDTYAKQKAEGQKLGSARPGHWDGREHKRGWKKAVKAASIKRAEVTENRYKYIMPVIREMREKGKTLLEIAQWLNSNGHLTTALKPFTETAVHRIIKRYLTGEYLGDITSKDHALAHVVAEHEGARRI